MSTNLRTCTTIDGRQIALPRERFVVRPSVYAVIVHTAAVLLVTNMHTGRFVLPGGAVDPGESLGEALAREVWEETGIAITDLQLCSAAEDFWYYDPTETAYHALLFLYTARPQAQTPSSRNQVDTDEGDPQWVPLADLHADAFHHNGEWLLNVIRAAGMRPKAHDAGDQF
jgi:8-oxo-dGTP pyrophosphatase MutT (NUDIX family)